MEPATRVALALGSGGARGYAHIGVIQVLEERGIEVIGVAGSSMGALVGGLYAAGKLDAYTEWVLGLSQFDVIRLLDLSVSAPGAIRVEKIFSRVRDLVDGALIEDLSIPFTAVATDLFARKEVWFQRGPLEVAIRASIAIPGLFTPVMLNGRLLADGGLMDPIPVAPTSPLRADATIGVDLGGDRSVPDAAAPSSETSEERPVEEWSDRFRRGVSRLLDSDRARALMARFGVHETDDDTDAALEPVLASDDVFGDLPAGLSRFEVMNLSLEAMHSVLARYRAAGFPPDVLVTVPKDVCRSLDFHRAADMIEIGRALTVEALDEAGLDGAEATSTEPESV